MLDKTGTITLNELSFDKPYLAKKGNTAQNFEGSGVSYTEEDLLLNAYFASEPAATDAIETATRNGAEKTVQILVNREKGKRDVPGYRTVAFIPFDPVTKFTEATIEEIATGRVFRCIKGAPQVIISKCAGHREATDAVLFFAERGLRSLGVAITKEGNMDEFEMVGMISLLDPPRPDSAATIKQCIKLGVNVKMVTGDQLIIAKEVARRLDMPRAILDATKLVDSDMSEVEMTDRVVKADGFAQVIPEHKFRVVELLQNRGYLVGMTGDGVNDAPALKKANVGIAVHGCTDAARSAADIVLLAPGLSTIVDGIMTSRAIFQRMKSYASKFLNSHISIVYRITSTIHFLIFFFISIIVFDFALPETLIILIAVLNDAATLVISVDNAMISQKPDKWRIGQLLTLSFILGVMLVGISFAHYFVALVLVDKNDPHYHGIIQTIMYLQISSCPHFVIFSTRLPSWFWENAPSPLFVFAVGATQVFALFVSVYGLEGLQATAM
jgi:H+-transporting ATPase